MAFALVVVLAAWGFGGVVQNGGARVVAETECLVSGCAGLSVEFVQREAVSVVVGDQQFDQCHVAGHRSVVESRVAESAHNH